MLIGTYYYPEQWPRTQWERDFDNIERMGMHIVHMAEFAWFQLEPQEGSIQLDWLAECVEMAHKRDLKVILCTPTAAPPIWLVEKHPEILPTDPHGRTVRFGGRRHYNPLAPAMIEASKRIVTAMADRFGKHPAIMGWQIDNEYGGAFDQSELTHQIFQAWLEERYKTIDALNQAWGCQFWNTQYTDFSQIRMPFNRDPEYGNPHQRLDASRFWSWSFAQFNKAQADILKPRVGDRFITTNLMPLHPDVNPDDLQQDLTLYSWDSYPVRTPKVPLSDQTFRMADPAAISLIHDQMASYGRWGLMELQPGQVNWSGTPILLYPGAIRLWIWTAFAHGAEFVTTYRYRQPRFGVEMFHHGLVGTDGVTPSAGGREFSQAAAEMHRLDMAKLTAVPAPVAAAIPRSKKAAAAATTSSYQTTVGLYLDFEQLWYYQTLPQAKRWNYGTLLSNLYGAIARLGLKVQIIRPKQPIPKDMKLLILPGVQMVDDAMLKSWTDYIAGGGNLLITCRTALMDRTGQFFEGPLASPIQGLIGGNIEAYDGLPEGASAKIELNDITYDWSIWGDLLYAEDTTKVLAKYADQFYEGAAAITQKKHGKTATVTYCGVFPDEPLADALIETLATQLKLPMTPTPRRVQIVQRGTYKVCLNYSALAFEVPAGKNARFVVGSHTIEPADVAVWEETE